MALRIEFWCLGWLLSLRSLFELFPTSFTPVYGFASTVDEFSAIRE